MYYKYIDGVKGISALLIVLCHLKMFGFISISNNLLVKSMLNGDIFVSLFIMISAFLVTNTIKRRENIKYGVRDFVLKRYLRFVVPIGVLLSIMMILYKVGFIWNEEVAAKNCNLVLSAQLSNMSCLSIIKEILLTPLGIGSGWLPQCWMMKYIFLGSIIIVVLHVAFEGICRNFRIAMCFFGSFLFFFFDPYYINVFIGYVIYDLVSNSSIKRGIVFVLAMSLVLYIVMCDFCGVSVRGFWGVIPALLVFLLIVYSKTLQKVFSLAFFVFLGKVSFSVYLLHVYVILSVGCWSYLYISEYSVVPVTILSLYFFSWFSVNYLEYCSYKAVDLLLSRFLNNEYVK